MKKSTPKTNKEDSETEEYTPEEIKKLDYYHELTNHVLDDDDIYDLMCKYGDDEDKILYNLKELEKEANRGEEYQWHEVGKSKLNIINIFLEKEKKVNKGPFKKNIIYYQKNKRNEENEGEYKEENKENYFYRRNNNYYYYPKRRRPYYRNNNYYKRNYTNYKSKDAVEVPDQNEQNDNLETKVIEKHVYKDTVLLLILN